MCKKRKNYSAQFKFQVALEAAKGLKTINQIGSEQAVHPTLVSHWKKRFSTSYVLKKELWYTSSICGRRLTP